MAKPFIILVAVFASVALLAIWVKLRVLRGAKRRSGLTEEQFVGALAAKGIPQEVGRAVFAAFRKWGSCIIPNFPLTPEVALREFSPWVEYDEDEIIHEVLSETGRQWPGKQLIPWSPDWTLEDVARFVAERPRTI